MVDKEIGSLDWDKEEYISARLLSVQRAWVDALGEWSTAGLITSFERDCVDYNPYNWELVAELDWDRKDTKIATMLRKSVYDFADKLTQDFGIVIQKVSVGENILRIYQSQPGVKIRGVDAKNLRWS